jgi:hypothetical protein
MNAITASTLHRWLPLENRRERERERAVHLDPFYVTTWAPKMQEIVTRLLNLVTICRFV